MTSDRDDLPAAPEDRARPRAIAQGAGAADLALTFRGCGPAYVDPRPGAGAAAESAGYEFHLHSWFDGQGLGVGPGEVGALVEAARSGAWDPLVDPLPAVPLPGVDGPTSLADVTVGWVSDFEPVDSEPVDSELRGACSAVVQVTGKQTTAAQVAGGRGGRRRRPEANAGWARTALTQTQPVDLDTWFRSAAASGGRTGSPTASSGQLASSPTASSGQLASSPDSAAVLTQPVDLRALFCAEDEHPSGPLPQAGTWPPQGEVPDSPARLTGPQISEAYDVTLTGALGLVELGFRGGFWYSITDSYARPVTVAVAMRTHPQLCGQITQLVCWWMRQHPMSDRALDLATELAMAVSEAAYRA